MKISQAQKVLNRKKILKSAVEIFTAQGFRNATMKEISKAAKLSEPAIYKYFPTKESLVYGFFEDNLKSTIEKIKAKPSFEELGFCEKIQSFMEWHLESLAEAREFTTESFKSIFVTNLPSSSTELVAQRTIFIDFVREQLVVAQSKHELPSSAFDGFFAELIWDFYVGIVYYWINDKSPDFINTTQLLDKSLRLLDEVLKTNVVSKILDIAHFLLRQHLFEGMAALTSLVGIRADGSSKN